MSKRSKRNRRNELATNAFVDGDMLQRMSKLAKEGSGAKMPMDGKQLGYNRSGWRVLSSGATEYNPAYDMSKGSKGLMEGGVTRSERGGERGDNHRYTGDTFYTSSSGKKDEHVFKCASDELDGKCPRPHKTPDIYINARVWDQWCHLCGEVDKEWIAFFRTERTAAGDYELRMFYFPPQTATGSSVDVPTGVMPQYGVNGAIHSHVKFSAFWSQTDRDHSNWPVEIVLNYKGEYKALVRVELACGSYTKEDAIVKLLGSAVEPDYMGKLQRAFVRGAKWNNRGAVENVKVEVAEVAEVAVAAPPPATAIVKAKVEPQGEGMGAQLAAAMLSMSGVSMEDVLDRAMEQDGDDCPECVGLGLVDLGPDGDTALCPKCNGWGKLLDGKAISARGPEAGA